MLIAAAHGPHVDEVLRVGGQLALTWDATARVVHFRERTPGHAGPTWNESAHEARLVAERSMDRIRQLGVSDTTCTVRAIDSRLIAHGITQEASNWGAHLLVIGARWQSAVCSLLFGGTSRAVVRRAPCPVIVIRPGSRLVS